MAFILFLKLGSCEYAKLETFYPMRKLLSDTKWQSKINTHIHKYKMQDIKWQFRINSCLQKMGIQLKTVINSQNSGHFYHISAVQCTSILNASLAVLNV